MWNDDDEDDLIEDMIGYHILMDDRKNSGGSRRPKGSGGCLSLIVFAIVILAVIALIGQCTGCI